MHCEVCRSLESGRDWRTAIAHSFEVDGGVDFGCPAGRAWIEELPWSTVRQAIVDAPDEGLWMLLKEQLRLREEGIALYGKRHGGCWVRRQRNSVVTAYQTVLAKLDAALKEAQV
jgi:hypothetical protein